MAARVFPCWLVFLATLVPAGACAQAFPAKPVRVVIPGSPGSNTDFFFRAISTRMGAALGQQLVADYRAGAGGVIGAHLTLKSPPDGYTIAMVAAGFVMNPALTRNMPYDPARDFTALGLVVDVPAMMVAHPSLPARNVKELVALARARPGQINFGSAGQGTVSHLAGVLFNLMAGVKTVHIPYKSSTPAIVDLIAGQIELSFSSLPGVVEHVKSGRIRMLAQTGRVRSPSVPDLPTMEEAGLPGYYVNSGFGLVAPPGVPALAVERLNGAMVKSVQDPAVRKVLLDNGADPVGGTPAEHDAFLKSEVARWKAVADKAGIKPE